MSRRSQLGSHAPHTGNLRKGYLIKMLSKMKLWGIPYVSIYSYSVTYVLISQGHAMEQPLCVSGNLTSE